MRRWIIAGAVSVLLPVLGLAALSLMSRRAPALGLRDGRLRACPDSPNCVCSFDSDADHHVDAIVFHGDPREAWDRLDRVLRGMPRMTLLTADDSYRHVTFATALFRFLDDVEFLMDAGADRIHVRSASRTGRSDLGTNRRRVEEIRRRFESAAN